VEEGNKLLLSTGDKVKNFKISGNKLRSKHLNQWCAGSGVQESTRFSTGAGVDIIDWNRSRSRSRSDF